MSRISRRDLLRSAVGATIAAPLVANARPFSRLADERPRIAIIGVAGRGEALLNQAKDLGQIVALCDVDKGFLAKAASAYPDAYLYTDYRALLTEPSDWFDGVTIAIPDHNHVVAAALAMRAKKAVYCEKPLTRTIGQARYLKEMARVTGVPTQMGNQGTANDNLRRAANYVREGNLGRIREVHCWTDRAKGWWPQSAPRPEGKRAPLNLDWRCWLGPAPYRPYADGYHSFAWRGRRDFGSGALGDMGCHVLNLLWHALDLAAPHFVEAESSPSPLDTYPDESTIRYHFNDFVMSWYDGGRKPPVVGDLVYGGNGGLIIGEKDTLYYEDAYGTTPRLLSGKSLESVPFVKSPGHMQEWTEAIQGGPMPRSNIVHTSGALTEFVLLGNVAIQAGGKMSWDAHEGRAIGRPDLDDFIRPVHTKGWELPEIPYRFSREA
ncbi:MAG: Gfo/Idh/MocA family oxidoreductase [Fimbriimonadaceae bacterium]|nr:Gfo/Idh/MocA family oxidoreductase [Fimbriimonadaceae bacterium]